jgi:hypothetical protein
MQPRLTGYVNQIYVQARTPSDVMNAISEVSATLLRRTEARLVSRKTSTSEI